MEEKNDEYIPFEEYSKLHLTSQGSDIGRVYHGTNGSTWGKGAAGILLYCPETHEILLLKRSPYVFDPNTWGIPGGLENKEEMN